MSKQSIALPPPRNEATTIRMAITCVDCGALRVFETIQALGGLLSRNVAHIGIETCCEHCGHTIAVTLLWDTPGREFSYTTPALGNAIGADDGKGLHTPLRKEKPV